MGKGAQSRNLWEMVLPDSQVGGDGRLGDQKNGKLPVNETCVS